MFKPHLSPACLVKVLPVFTFSGASSTSSHRWVKKPHREIIPSLWNLTRRPTKNRTIKLLISCAALAPPYLHGTPEKEEPQYKTVFLPVAPLTKPCFPLLNIANERGSSVVASAVERGTKAATIGDFIFAIRRISDYPSWFFRCPRGGVKLCNVARSD